MDHIGLQCSPVATVKLKGVVMAFAIDDGAGLPAQIRSQSPRLLELGQLDGVALSKLSELRLSRVSRLAFIFACGSELRACGRYLHGHVCAFVADMLPRLFPALPRPKCASSCGAALTGRR